MGASVHEAARVTGWSPARVRREAAAALAQLQPANGRAPANGQASLPAREAVAGAALTDGAAVLPQRPAVAAEVVVEPAPPDGAHRVVHDPRSGRYARMKLPQAALLESLDGTRALDELRDSPTWPPGMALALVRRFAEMGLLAGTPTQPPARQRMGGYALKLATLDPERLLARGGPVIRALGSAPALAAAAFLMLLGTVAFAVHLDAGLLTSDRLADPVVLATLLAALLTTAMIHELGHAGAVAFHGGRVRRLGVMLFYLMPALFCDTSDAWRFAFARQRVVVALAGVATQLVVVGAVAQLLWLGLGDAARAWVLLYVLLNLGMCAYNLIPFVKLDGYWALSAALDRPSLRAQAIDRSKAWIGRLLFAEPAERRPGDVPAVAFGIACALFAPALIVYALLRWEDLLLRLGTAGATVWLVLLAVVAARPAKAAVAALRTRLRHPGARPARATGSLLAVLAVVAACAAVVRVPVSAGGELATAGASQRVPATLSSGAVGLVEPGDRAELGDRSLTSERPEARGTVVRRSKDRWLVELAAGERRPAGDGVTVRTGRHPVAAWLWHAHLRPAFSALRW